MAQCKKCGAPIVFISLPSGKVMPCDEQILEGQRDPRGTEVLITDKGEVVRCRVDNKIPTLPVPVSGRKPHWATCPYADEFRNSGK